MNSLLSVLLQQSALQDCMRTLTTLRWALISQTLRCCCCPGACSLAAGMWQSVQSRKLPSTHLLTPHSRQALAQHSSLLPTLARVLKEDGRRSVELAAAVASVFFSLSTVRQLHAAISELQVGAMLLDLCQLEVTRTGQRIAEDGSVAPRLLAARLVAAATRQKPELCDR
jgi:hypothetical protein